MLIKKPADIKAAEITPKELYMNRRQFMLSASALARGDVVLDWNQWNRALRAEASRRARLLGAVPLLHWIDLPIDVAVERTARSTIGRNG